MLRIKTQLCRDHLESLDSGFARRDKTALHLLAAVEVAETLLRKNNDLEADVRRLHDASE